MLSDTLFPFESIPIKVTCDRLDPGDGQPPDSWELAPCTFDERAAAIVAGHPLRGHPHPIQVDFVAHDDADQREIIQTLAVVLYRVAENPGDARLAKLRKKQVCWVMVEGSGSKVNAAGVDSQLITDEKAAEIRKLGDSATGGKPAAGAPAGAAAGSQAHRKRFRAALSFPGERRPFVSQVAEVLANRLERRRVLYDKYHEAEFARVDLDTHLQQAYHDESDLIAVFLCVEYNEKEWCGLEWRAIRDLIKMGNGGLIMPLRFDDAKISGLFSNDGYVDIGSRPPDEIAALIMQRLEQNDQRTAQ